jgi:hypothetical protein
MSRRAILVLAFVVGGCGLVQLADPYGNVYGDWYNHGQQYRAQLATCEHEIDQRGVPDPRRKGFMRCCMWRHGVPIDDAGACAATG